jgi:formyltetrahydrofolate-dependent phosphoribosylglycinamide formyltransferase
MPQDAFHPETLTTLRQMRDRLDRAGKKMVFTNGCFDLLHPGHIRYLQQARNLGDALVVAINSDASVRALKGPTRPINPELDRAEVIAALRCVDAVVLFEDQRATRLIEQIQPHLYAKGGDYTPESLDPEERAALGKVGAEIRILPLVPGRSTTNIVAKLQPPPANPAPTPTTPLRLGILGSGQGSNFAAILDAITSGQLHAEIALALTDTEDSPFMALAEKHRIPTALVDCGPNPLRTTAGAQQQINDCLLNAGVDVVVLTGFMRVLKHPTLTSFAGRIVNVHPSLLPRHKGRHAVSDALTEGASETGCTVHLVTAEIDAGQILAQGAVPILAGDTVETLHQRIKKQEHVLLPQVLQQWLDRGLPTRTAPAATSAD